jgi:hypothetical protein
MCIECNPLGSNNNQKIFYSQLENTVALPFNSEVNVLTLPVTNEQNNQRVKIDSSVQVQASIALGLTAYQYTVILRLRRNGTLITTKTLAQGAAAVLTLAFTQVNAIPFTFVDEQALLGLNTYTVTLQFSQRSNVLVTTSVQTRAINAIVFNQ